MELARRAVGQAVIDEREASGSRLAIKEDTASPRCGDARGERLIADCLREVPRKERVPPAIPGRLARPAVAYTNLLKTAL